MRLIDCYDEFIEHQLVSGNSEATIQYYYYCLRPFIKYYGFDYNSNNLSIAILRKYALILRNKDLSSVSVRSYSKGIKVFLTWLFINGYTKINLSLSYILPKAQSIEINILSDKEIYNIMNTFNINTQLGLRNYCIIALMLDNGLRKSEIIKLTLNDYNSLQNSILINGKGNKQRILHLGLQLKKYLNHYILTYGCSINQCIFSTLNNTPITQSTINRLIKTLKSQTNINRLHAHLFRHTFATNYLINKGNITTLQYLLGHSDISTVQIYLHLAQNNIKTEFMQHSYLDKLNYQFN